MRSDKYVLRLYPRTWRQRYEEEVLAMLAGYHATFFSHASQSRWPPFAKNPRDEQGAMRNDATTRTTLFSRRSQTTRTLEMVSILGLSLSNTLSTSRKGSRITAKHTPS
jgi:hypothetical protein